MHPNYNPKNICLSHPLKPPVYDDKDNKKITFVDTVGRYVHLDNTNYI